MSIGSKTTNGSVMVALSLVLTKGVFVFNFRCSFDMFCASSLCTDAFVQNSVRTRVTHVFE